MGQNELPHLFRTEFRKLTAVLCKTFGIEHIETAEDIASETFLAAFETWSYKGIPDNPTAWLYTVARNKAATHIKRHRVFVNKVAGAIESSSSSQEPLEIDLSNKNIHDSQLQMLFAICHPAIAAEAQIGLALRILCGFGIEEIANAMLSSKDTINKRLFRAKEKLRQENVKIEFPEETDVQSRLQTVLTTLYLLFNEGYYSESTDTVVRHDLCLEAMRLTYLLTEYEPTNLPVVNALLALMCFHASRFKARTNKTGDMILYDDQDENLWDRELIAKGGYHLNQAAKGTTISTYHLEASIAYWHTVKTDSKEKWEAILQLFNHLLQLQYSPVAALNRTYAYAKVYGKAAAIEEAEKLKLTNNHFYFVLLGELYSDSDTVKARQNLTKGLALASTQRDKRMIREKIDRLKN